jgi:hypothetical protein
MSVWHSITVYVANCTVSHLVLAICAAMTTVVVPEKCESFNTASGAIQLCSQQVFMCLSALACTTEAAALIAQELRKALFKRLLQMVSHLCVYIRVYLQTF